MARLAADNQLGMDEELVENPDVEAALVERQARKDALSSVRKEFKAAHNKAIALLSLIELPEDGAVRVGRFRITNRFVAGAHREFDTSDRSQVSIAFLKDEQPRAKAASSTSDDADLRPAGEVNVDALKGEVARASTEPTPFRPRANGTRPSAPN